jgi:hypothetical protein
MKREGTIGAATFLAIAAVVGVSLSGGKPDVGGKPDTGGAVKRSHPSVAKTKAAEKLKSGCSGLQDELEGFLDIESLLPPDECYEGSAPTRNLQDLSARTSQLKFVIATMADPVHTHLPVLFDQFAVAIQEGAQDEKYDFDSSWMPWDEEDQTYALLDDQKAANEAKELKEEQPGIILFRKHVNCMDKEEAESPDCQEASDKTAKKGKGQEPLSRSYREGLIVFVVGEEATQGIHREQFQNALEWIADLQNNVAPENKRIGILGPTFSGSFPSLSQVLSESKTKEKLFLGTPPDRRLAVFSGSVSGSDAAGGFQKLFKSQVTFHSFVQNDDEILRRFCAYMKAEQDGFDPTRVAIVSEDETAYGSSGVKSKDDGQVHDKRHADKARCPDDALWLYYPRDISALRAAYQTKSLFDVGTSPQTADTQRRNLPSDLADPSGKVHDSIRSYGGNQTPLNQEAALLEIVAALRALKARYIFVRGSSALDQLFLTNFLRRGYPDGRMVIFGPDLMFIRERGSTGLSGVMTLGTYPLFPLERDWTEHQAMTAADRVFSSDTTEGTYIALRLLLSDDSLSGKSFSDPKRPPERCQVGGPSKDKIFLPSVICNAAPLPDYSPPFWTIEKQCGEMDDEKKNQGDQCPYPGPATWLSVIGTNRFWPMAALTEGTPLRDFPKPESFNRATKRNAEPGGLPTMPLEMKVFLLVLVGFATFHALCCWAGSYTAKPAFLAHFAGNGDWRHSALVFCGSCCVAFLAIVTGWGCGVFSSPAPGLPYPWFALCCVSFICAAAWFAILTNRFTAWQLATDVSGGSLQPRMTEPEFGKWNYRISGLFLAAVLLFYLAFFVPIDRALLVENQVLTYWRAMHLASNVSPIVPILLVFGGLYVSFWFSLHGLALFGRDRPRLPLLSDLALTIPAKPGTQPKVPEEKVDFLRMFSRGDAESKIEAAALPLNWKLVTMGAGLFGVFLAAAFGMAEGVPIRSLGAQRYAVIFLVLLDFACVLVIVETCRLCQLWQELKRLLAFLDRLPLRRTLASLHGFSWGGVWKMSGNVLEVRYKVISRQMECMNHTLASLEEFVKTASAPGTQESTAALGEMRDAGFAFADWYSTNYTKFRAGDLNRFKEFQHSIAKASGTLFSKLLVPAWRAEKKSLLVAFAKEEKDDAAPSHPRLADLEHVCHAEEFVCLNYLSFVQNILGRLRTMTLTIMLLLIVSIVAVSTYPFDPRQALSAVLIVLFVGVGLVVVKVYAEMHRDSTLSHVTNTKPGELGTEFWFKIVGFGLAPLLGLLARVFPGIPDFIFSWVQPSLSSLK